MANNFCGEYVLNAKTAPIFMNDMHRVIIYLDTGLEPVPIGTLEAMAQFFELPYEVLSIELDFLKQAILTAQNEVQK